MKKFRTLKIVGERGELLNLLDTLKEINKAPFSYKKTRSEGYAKNIFKKEEEVGCFTTKRKSLFQSSVWMVLSQNEIRITNIVSPTLHELGVVNYNMVLMEFFSTMIKPNLTDEYQVHISGDEVSLKDTLGNEIYHLLNSWADTCNKEHPLSHPSDLALWLRFLIALYNSEIELSEADLTQWLREDKGWPLIYEPQLIEVADKYLYGLELLKEYNHYSNYGQINIP